MPRHHDRAQQARLRRSPLHRSTCPVTGTISFSRPKDVRLVLRAEAGGWAKITLRGGTRSKAMSYYCTACKGYHQISWATWNTPAAGRSLAA